MNNVIVIEEVKLVSGSGRNAKYSAIGNDSHDHSSEISKDILKRAVEGWNGKKIVYFNPEVKKWQRTETISKIKALAPKASKSKTQSASVTDSDSDSASE
jgi:gentisate 1,2-dioxygenase